MSDETDPERTEGDSTGDPTDPKQSADSDETPGDTAVASEPIEGEPASDKPSMRRDPKSPPFDQRVVQEPASDGTPMPAREPSTDTSDEQPHEFDKRHRRLNEREMGLDKRSDDLDERERELDERERELDERERELANRRQELQDAEAHLEQRKAGLDDRENELEEYETRLSERATELDEHEETLNRYIDEQVTDLEERIQEVIRSGLDSYETNRQPGRFGPAGNLLVGFVGLVLVVAGTGYGAWIGFAGTTGLFNATVGDIAVAIGLFGVGLAVNLVTVAERL